MTMNSINLSVDITIDGIKFKKKLKLNNMTKVKSNMMIDDIDPLPDAIKLKKGDTIKFNFHAFGVVSQEETEIIEITKDYIQISDGDPEYKFDRKTGKCLNDNTDFGCRRSLPDEYLV